MVMTLSNILTISKSVFPPNIASMNFLSSLVRVEKSIELRPRAKLEKTPLNSLVLALMEVLVVASSTSNTRSWGKGNTAAKASISGTRTRVSSRVEIFPFLKWMVASAIMTGGAKFTYSRDKGRSQPSASRGTISPTIVSIETRLSRKKSSSMRMRESPLPSSPRPLLVVWDKKKTLGQALYRKSHDTSPSPLVINPVRIKRG